MSKSGVYIDYLGYNFLFVLFTFFTILYVLFLFDNGNDELAPILAIIYLGIVIIDMKTGLPKRYKEIDKKTRWKITFIAFVLVIVYFLIMKTILGGIGNLEHINI